MVTVETHTGHALYSMFQEDAVYWWSYWCFVFVFSLQGKIFSMSDNPSLDSVDSEYDMGSVQRDLHFLEDNPSLKDMMLANPPSPRVTSPFVSLRPANPAMQALSAQKREAHNRSPVSFREGRRASDTSLTQGALSTGSKRFCCRTPWGPLPCWFHTCAHLKALVFYLNRLATVLSFRNCSI